MNFKLRANSFLKNCFGMGAIASVLCLSASVAAQAQVTSGQSYRILSACATNKVVSIAGGSTLNEAPAVLATKNTSAKNQIFQFRSSGRGYVVIAQHSGKALDVYQASKALNAPIQQYTIHGQSNQIFLVSRTSDGFVQLKNQNSGHFLNLARASTVDGTKFEQYSNLRSCAQKYKLELVSSPSPSPAPAPQPAPTPAPQPAPAPAPAPTPAPAPARDPMKQPFASNSIWNMPIGSGAQYVHANLSDKPANDEWAPMPHVDDEIIVMKPTAPLVNVNYSDAGWTGKNRCNATGGLLVQVPVPSDYTVPHNNANGSAVFLMSDKRTLIHTQPFTRCVAGGPATSLVKFNPVDLYGDGRAGSHGGSGLSAIGGSIRIGELRPGQQGPRHALKVNVYAKGALFRCSNGSDCWKWPADTADGYAVGFYGTDGNNSNTAMKMGALLAIPSSVNIANMGLETEPGRQLAWTLQNYGAYIVDDTYGPAFAFNIEKGPDGSKREEFKADYGFEFEQRVRDNTPWVRDIQRLVRTLHAVANNGPNSIGGGGTPRQPLAAPISP